MENNIALGLVKVKIYIPSAHSLKEKRKVVKSLKEKVRNKFNVSVAEVDYQDYHQSAFLAIAMVSNDAAHLVSQSQKISEFIQMNLPSGTVFTDFETF
ncbi:MAG: DUF503 domain-containing protein [Planctomycetota bacterium]|nr:MAG: DUF503 domain-containing protein [Planctomycetota bacterium]